MSDNQQMLTFLNILYGGCSSGMLSIWDIVTKLSKQFPILKIDEAVAYAYNLAKQKRDIYFGVGLLDKELPVTKRGTEADIIALPGVYADIDIAGSNHKSNKQYPTSMESVMDILKLFPASSIIISTGGGIHCYWLFNEPLIISSDSERKRAKSLLVDMQSCLREELNKHGFDMDNTADLARVLRLPGSHNHKNDQPAPVKIIEPGSDQVSRYTIEEIEAFITGFKGANIADVLDKPDCTRSQEQCNAGPVGLLVRNCSFIRYCGSNSEQLPEPEWHAMTNNMALAKDGSKEIHQFSKPYSGYSYDETQKKIDRAINEPMPHTCSYIQDILGFSECPEGGCPVSAPIGWATSTIAIAMDTIKVFFQSSSWQDDPYNSKLFSSFAELYVKDRTRYFRYEDLYLGKFGKGVGRRKFLQIVVAEATKIQGNMEQSDDDPILKELEEQLGYKLSIPEGYFIRDGKVWLFKNEQTMLIVPQVLAFERIFTGEMRRVGIILRQRARWSKILTDPFTIASRSKIVELANQGLKVNSETAPGLVQYLTSLELANPDIPMVEMTNHYGWQSQGEFLPGNSNKQLMISCRDRISIKNVESRGDIDQWLKQVTHMREYKVARAVLAASFAAPMLEPLGIRSFLIHIWGPSQGGKTAAMVAAGSVWLSKNEILMNFNATNVGLEFQLGLLKNLPVLIDERQIARNQSNIDTLVYMLGEGTGRIRGNKAGGVSLPPSWRTVVVTSGEHPLSDGNSSEGVKTRALEIYTKSVIDDSDYAGSLHRLGDDCYGYAGALFIQKLVQYPDLKATYEQHLAEMKSKYPDLPGSYYSYLAIILLADCLASQWVFGVGTEEALRQANAMITEIATVVGTRGENNEANRAYGVIESWIYQNINRFDNFLSNNVFTSDISGNVEYRNQNPYGERYGWIRKGVVYVFPNVLNDIVKEYGYNLDRLKRDFADKGWLRTGKDDGNVTYTVTARRISGENPCRVYGLNIKLSENNANHIDMPVEECNHQDIISEDLLMQ